MIPQRVMVKATEPPFFSFNIHLSAFGTGPPSLSGGFSIGLSSCWFGELPAEASTLAIMEVMRLVVESAYFCAFFISWS